MRKYWFNWMLTMVCLVLLVGLPIPVRAETAGVAVTAVKETDEPEPSSGQPEEEPGDGNHGEEPDGKPDEKPDDAPGENPDGEVDDASDNPPDEKPDDTPGGNPDGEPDDMPDNNPDDGLNEGSDGCPEDESGNDEEPGGEPKAEQKGYPDKRFIHKIIFVVAALAGAGILGAITGLWDYLWLLMMWYLFKKRRCKWHGILTEDENRFIEIRPAGDDYCLAQEIIDYSSEPAEAMRMLEETGDITYLPVNCKVRVSFQIKGECWTEKVRCNESRFYEFMEKLGDVGEKRVLIENRAAKIQILLVYP